MTEEELFEVMKKEYPQDGDTSFLITKDHWMHRESGEETTYKISLVPLKWDVKLLESKHSWDELHLIYLDWRREQDV